MRVEGLELIKPETAKKLEALYGTFAVGPDGQPLDSWEARHLRRIRLGVAFRHSAFPNIWLKMVLVNRKIVPPLTAVYHEVAARWTVQHQHGSGLDLFQKCYCFGDGDSPNLFWYGAAWQLAAQVKGEVLRETVKIFVRNGFTPREDNERILEYW